MRKDYKTIREVVGPLMLVDQVEGVKYDELVEIQQANGEIRSGKVLVIDGDKLYVLDWEFAGMNDPFYDIACYGNAGFDKALSLLECYVGHQPTADELKRLSFHRAFQCLQWYNVAIFKDRVGLSKDLNMDFNAVALMFLGMARDLIEK